MNAPKHTPLMIALLLTSTLFAAGCDEEVDTSLIVASGHVDATEVTLSSKIPGTLEWFELEEGDRITQGDEIARIDTVDLRLQLDAAEADRSLADAVLRLRQAGFRNEEIAEASAQVARARADRDAAERDLERFQALLDRGSGTEKTRDDALARAQVAAETVSAAEARLELLRAGSRPEELDEARARLAAADARIAQIEQQIRDASVLSPVSGVVTAKIAEQGELLRPDGPLAVVTDLDNAWLTAYVGNDDLGRIRIGQSATVITDDGQEREGRLTFINPVAEFTPKNVQTRDERTKLVYRIKVSLDNHDGLYKMGMPAEAHFRADQEQ
ncbi:MAG: efflux RND transporter periplasmic adaptor subunit [Acidobacteriota bacterium]|jgi:HlyD family secretion protein